MDDINNNKNNHVDPVNLELRNPEKLDSNTTGSITNVSNRNCFRRNLSCLCLCYTLAFSCITLVIGNSTVVYTNNGGSPSSAPLTIASFFLGSSIISLFTPVVFDSYGRRIGFMIGNLFGIIGAVIGTLAVLLNSSVLVIVSCIPLGLSNGFGLHLRYAAMEIVPPGDSCDEKKAFAMTLVLSGGCISAFLGPEVGEVTKDLFSYTYLGTYVAVAVFNILGILLMYHVTFPNVKQNDSQSTTITVDFTNMRNIMQGMEFLEPAMLSGLSWVVMATPMSVLRIAMRDVGFTSRESLLVLEGHFLGMFSPGLFSGKLIQKYGASKMSIAGGLIFFAGIVANIFVTTSSVLFWAMGLILIGVGWNFSFSSATLWLSRLYKAHEPAVVQACNDFLMFGIAGFAVLSSGYVYDGAGSELDGWRILNICMIVFLVALVYIPAMDIWRT